jgi:hypothetical protein
MLCTALASESPLPALAGVGTLLRGRQLKAAPVTGQHSGSGWRLRPALCGRLPNAGGGGPGGVIGGGTGATGSAAAALGATRRGGRGE